MSTYIIDAIRTPIGNFGGTLKDVRTDDLGAIPIRELIRRTGIDPSKIDENAEWELLGAAWNDEHEWGNTPVLELDSSQQSVQSLFSQIGVWRRDGFKPKSPEQRIDWITILHGE